MIEKINNLSIQDKKDLMDIIFNNNLNLEYIIEDNNIVFDFNNLTIETYTDIENYLKSIESEYLNFNIVNNKDEEEEYYNKLSKKEINIIKRNIYEDNIK